MYAQCKFLSSLPVGLLIYFGFVLEAFRFISIAHTLAETFMSLKTCNDNVVNVGHSIWSTWAHSASCF